MSERGGVTLLVAVGLMTGFAAAALLAHRAVVREWAMEGDALLGARASLAADASLAWFLKEGWKGIGPEVRVARLPAPPDLLSSGASWRVEGDLRVVRLGIREDGSTLWKATVTGRCRVLPSGRPYLQVREAYVTQGEGGPPVLRAWRIAR